jgi:hypothetical protein
MSTIVEVHVNISLCNNGPSIDNFKKRRIYLTRQCQDKKCTEKPRDHSSEREKSFNTAGVFIKVQINLKKWKLSKE